jgi:hypothetical protein
MTTKLGQRMRETREILPGSGPILLEFNWNADTY